MSDALDIRGLRTAPHGWTAECADSKCGMARQYAPGGRRLWERGDDTCAHGNKAEDIGPLIADRKREQSGDAARRGPDPAGFQRIRSGGWPDGQIKFSELAGKPGPVNYDPPTDPTLAVLERLTAAVERLCEVLELREIRNYDGLELCDLAKAKVEARVRGEKP